jgi:adenylate kinase
MFDGFPRTLEQARALDEALHQRNRRIDAVLYMSVPEDVLLKRIAGRRTCKNCGAVFNIYYFAPKQEGICDSCGSDQLYQRSDDTLETAQNRLDVYFRQTMPLIDYYRERNTLREVNGNREVESVTHDMMELLNGHTTNG